MSDLISPIFQLPHPNPDDPLGGIAGTLDDFVTALEDEVRWHRRRLGGTTQSTSTATTTTTEIVATSHSFSTRIGDSVEYEWDGFVHSTVAGDWIQLDLHDGNLAGPVIESVAVQTVSTIEARSNKVRIYHLLPDATSAGFRTLTLGIRRIAGTGNVKRFADSTHRSYARSYRSLRAPA